MNPLNRRMFLRGVGGFTLAIPTLSSLLPRAARAQAAAPAVRYVQWVNNHGQFAERFWPDDQHLPVDPAVVNGAAVPGVAVRTLSSIPGALSTVLGPEFDGVRDRMNLVRGLDLMVGANFHNNCVPTCASWPREDHREPFFPHSADSVMAESTAVYPSGAPVPVLRLTPGVSSSYKWGSFSWTRQNGVPFRLPAKETSQAALSEVFGAGASGGSPLLDPTVAARLRLTDQVLEDYRHLVTSRALAHADKQQLESYMDLLADVQNRMQLEAPSCTPPEQLGESDFDILHKNVIDIVVAALLCGNTRVVAYHAYQGSPTQYDEETFHNWAHNDVNRHAEMARYRMKHLARLLVTMDSFVESNGRTLLDNALVYANNELSAPGHGEEHLRNMPIITAGSANDQLVTGQYIDFGGRLMNSMLITAFTVMGMGPADYEREGVVGFGDYTGSSPELYAPYTSTSARRSPLPYLYKA